MRLHVYSSETALEAAIDRRLDAGSAIELGRGMTSTARLLDEAARALPASIGSLAEMLIVRRVLSAPIAGRALPRSAATGVHAIVSSLRRSGVTASALQLAAPRLQGRPGDDARFLAALLDRYEGLLGSRLDEATRVHQAIVRLGSASLASLRDVTSVDMHDVTLEPLERAVLDALASRGLPVRVQLLDPPPRAIEGAAGVYEDALASALTVQLDALEATGAGLIDRVAIPIGHGPVPYVVRAASLLDEARLIARHVHDLVASGIASDEIVVVAEQPDVRVRVAVELEALRVPIEHTLRGRVLESAAARLLPAIERIVAERMPRDALLDLLSSPILSAPPRLAATLRRSVPSTLDRDALRTLNPDDPLVRYLLDVIDRLTSLPARATLPEHLGALRGLLEHLGLFSTIGVVRGGPPGDDAVGRGRSREEAAIRAIDEIFDELPRAARRVGLERQAYERAEVAAILASELAARPLPGSGAHGAAVVVSDLARSPDATHLVLAGLEDGAMPAGTVEDPLLSDETRHVLNRAFDRPLLSLASHAEARARARLGLALHRARTVRMYAARADVTGRPRLAGELVAFAEARGASVSSPRFHAIPTVTQARTTNELVARVRAERSGDDALRDGLEENVLSALERRLHGPLLQRVVAMSRMEAERAGFFAGDRPAGRHDGRIARDDLREALIARLPGTSRRPLSASTITRYVECPQRFFLATVLRVDADETLADEIDERATGALAHLALEALFRAWKDAGLFPLRGAAEEQAHIPHALAWAAAEFSRESPRGNDLVFASRVRALGRMLDAIWRREIERGTTPIELELRFDGVTVPGAVDGEAPVHLRGAIDRVDRAGDRAIVYDYKSGRLDRLKHDLLPEAWGETSWQLPIYAAVVRDRLGVEDVDMAYYSLKEIAVAHAVAPARLAFSSTDEDGLAARLWRRVRAMREGRFDVAPLEDACTRCGLQAACRIVERRTGDDE